MEEKNAKKFELNTKILDNFDQVMAVKLDEIEELKITGLDRGSKILNIVSLCANVKTLIIEGDRRLHVDEILANIFKPDKLENLVFQGVKLPTQKALTRFPHLKSICLNEIHFCNVIEFLENVVCPEKIETLELSNVDMMGNSMNVLERFSYVKELGLEKLENAKFENLKFLRENQNLSQLKLLDIEIPIDEMNHLLYCGGVKQISISFTDGHGKLESANQVTTLQISMSEFLKFAKEVNLNRIQKLEIKIDKALELSDYMSKLKYQKSEVAIFVKDFSCLDAQNAKKLKKKLRLQSLQMWNGKNKIAYKIDTYITIREELEKIIENVSEEVSEPEKFLTVYQYLGKGYAPNHEYTARSLCEILQNSLRCLQIKSNLIMGKDLEHDQKHYWNQVELEGKWYNLDLVLDVENIQKNKAEYCLLGDKSFLETHLPKSGKNTYCAENFNQKLVNVFLKTGLYQENLFGSYLEMIANKIKQVLRLNRKQEVLALPEGEEDEEE